MRRSAIICVLAALCVAIALAACGASQAGTAAHANETTGAAGDGDSNGGDISDGGDSGDGGDSNGGNISGGGDSGDSGAAAGTKRLRVVASIYPMYDFAKKIGGGAADVDLLMPAGAEPHEWEPTPADIAALERADVFVYNGMGIEPWADRVLASLGNGSIITCVASQNTAHGMNPHVWLDPSYAKQQLANIKAAFERADPAQAAQYGKALEEWTLAMDSLDAEFAEALSDNPGASSVTPASPTSPAPAAPIVRREVFVTHDAFGYMCDAYGLTQVAAVGISPDAEPEPARMAEVIRQAKERGATTIFYEDNGSPKVAQAIAESIGGKTAALSPVEAIGEVELAAGEDYFTKMRANLAALMEALR